MSPRILLITEAAVINYFTMLDADTPLMWFLIASHFLMGSRQEALHVEIHWLVVEES